MIFHIYYKVIGKIASWHMEVRKDNKIIYYSTVSSAPIEVWEKFKGIMLGNTLEQDVSVLLHEE